MKETTAVGAKKKLYIGRGMRRRITKAGHAAAVRFMKDVTVFLASLGAKRTEGVLGEARFDAGALSMSGGQHILETTFGTLQVTPYDNWIACCFKDVERARSMHCNPHSGKWNFHYNLAESIDWSDFQNQLRRIAVGPNESA